MQTGYKPISESSGGSKKDNIGNLSNRCLDVKLLIFNNALRQKYDEIRSEYFANSFDFLMSP